MKIRVLIALAFVVFLAGCSKDDEKPQKVNEFTFDGVSYPIKSVVYGQFDEEFDFYFLADGVTYDEEVEYFTGDGAVAALFLMSTELTFVAGKYSALGERDWLTPLTVGFTGAVFELDPDIGLSPEGFGWPWWTDWTSPNTGSATVKIDGDVYTFEFNLTTNGKNIKGYYKGTLAHKFQ
jgi:hypothetical protein